MSTQYVELSDYLEHHGILGQKWGVRRYQNKDGTLTAAGKKRYAKIGASDRDAEVKRDAAKKLTDAMRNDRWVEREDHAVFEALRAVSKYYRKTDSKTGIEYVDRNDIDKYVDEAQKVANNLKYATQVRLDDYRLSEWYDAGVKLMTGMENMFAYAKFDIFPKGEKPVWGGALSAKDYKKQLMDDVKRDAIRPWLDKKIGEMPTEKNGWGEDWEALYDLHSERLFADTERGRRLTEGQAKQFLEKYDLSIDDWLTTDRAVDDYYNGKKIKHSQEGGTDFKMEPKYLELSSVLTSLDPEYLEHHGIKGQKWGVEHGPPYPLKNGVSARIKRAAKSVKNRVESNRQQRTAKKEAKEEARRQKKPTLDDKVKAMSNEELLAAADRLRKENAYLDELGRRQARQGESFLKKASKTLNTLKTFGDAVNGFVETGKRLGKTFGLDEPRGNDESPTRRQGESLKDYTTRMAQLASLKKSRDTLGGNSSDDDEKKKKS